MSWDDDADLDAPIVPSEEPLAPEVAGLDAATRAALADAWGQEALSEHASIASFARFVIQLLALGAPSDLVIAAQRALGEEHDHARTCLGLASAYAGIPLSPGALDVGGALDGGASPAAIAASLAGEGCVAETVSALQIACARDEARDPVVKAALARIAEQEMAHALLAWRTLDWVLSRGDAAVRAAVAGVFAEAEAHGFLSAMAPAPSHLGMSGSAARACSTRARKTSLRTGTPAG